MDINHTKHNSLSKKFAIQLGEFDAEIVIISATPKSYFQFLNSTNSKKVRNLQPTIPKYTGFTGIEVFKSISFAK